MLQSPMPQLLKTPWHTIWSKPLLSLFRAFQWQAGLAMGRFFSRNTPVEAGNNQTDVAWDATNESHAGLRGVWQHCSHQQLVQSFNSCLHQTQQLHQVDLCLSSQPTLRLMQGFWRRHSRDVLRPPGTPENAPCSDPALCFPIKRPSNASRQQPDAPNPCSQLWGTEEEEQRHGPASTPRGQRGAGPSQGLPSQKASPRPGGEALNTLGAGRGRTWNDSFLTSAVIKF